jgi:hypothetical protein
VHFHQEEMTSDVEVRNCSGLWHYPKESRFFCQLTDQYLTFQSSVQVSGAITTQLWENYFPGAKSIQARFKRVKVLFKQRNIQRGLPGNFVPRGRRSAADPIMFCKHNFTPVSYSDQYEFKACLQALNVSVVQIEAGESNVATDISGTPAGRNQPDGPDSLSPGSAGWSRW